MPINFETKLDFPYSEQSSCSRETEADNQTQIPTCSVDRKIVQTDGRSSTALNTLIQRMKRSKCLEISSHRTIQVTSELFKDIADAFSQTDVLIVNLSNLPLNDSEGLFTQIPSHFFSEQIQSLTITRSKIGDEGFKHLCTHLSQMKRCFTVNLKNNLISEEGFRSVLPLLEKLETIIKIDLQHNSIKDKEELRELTAHLKHSIRF